MRSNLTLNDLQFIGMRGTVLALDAETGQEVWRTFLKGSDFTNIMLTRENSRVLAATRGEIFALDALTGKLLWNNPLKGMGYGLITFAANSQASAAEQSRNDDAHNTAMMMEQQRRAASM